MPLYSRKRYWNQRQALGAQLQILQALATKDELSFNLILKRTGISSRTLSKHLPLLQQKGFIAKQERFYHITDTGLEEIEKLKDDLKKIDRQKYWNSTPALHDFIVVGETIPKSALYGHHPSPTAGRYVGTIGVSSAAPLDRETKHDISMVARNVVVNIAEHMVGLKEKVRGFNINISTTLPDENDELKE